MVELSNEFYDSTSNYHVSVLESVIDQYFGKGAWAPVQLTASDDPGSMDMLRASFISIFAQNYNAVINFPGHWFTMTRHDTTRARVGGSGRTPSSASTSIDTRLRNAKQQLTKPQVANYVDWNRSFMKGFQAEKSKVIRSRQSESYSEPSEGLEGCLEESTCVGRGSGRGSGRRRRSEQEASAAAAAQCQQGVRCRMQRRAPLRPMTRRGPSHTDKPSGRKRRPIGRRGPGQQSLGMRSPQRPAAAAAAAAAWRRR